MFTDIKKWLIFIFQTQPNNILFFIISVFYIGKKNNNSLEQ